MKFKPPSIFDKCVLRNGDVVPYYGKLQCITCMEFYENVSPEELRFGEYNRQHWKLRRTIETRVKFKPLLTIDSSWTQNGEEVQIFSKLQCITCTNFYKDVSLEELRLAEYNSFSTNTFETKPNDDICKPFGNSSNFTSGAKSSTFGKVAADSSKTLTFGDRLHGTSQFAYAMTKSTAELPESNSNIKPCSKTTSTPKIIFDAGNSSTTPEKSPFAKNAFEGGSLTPLSSTTLPTNSLSTTAITVATKKPAFTFGAQPAMSIGLTLDSSLKNGSSTNTFETKPHDNICKPFGDSSNFTSGAQSSTFGKVAPDSGKKLTFGDQPHGTSQFAYIMNKSTTELPEGDSNIKPCPTTTSTPKIIFDAGNSSTTPEKNPFAKSVFKDGSSSSFSAGTPWTNSLSTTATEKPDFTFGAQPAISVGLTRGSSLKNGFSTNTFETKPNDDTCKPFGNNFNFASGAQSSTFGKVAADSSKTLIFGDRPHGTSQFAYAMIKSTAELPESDSNIKPCPTTTLTPKIIFDAGNSSITPEKSPFAKSAFEGGSLTPLSSGTPWTNSLSTTATEKPVFTFGAQPAISLGLTRGSSLKNGSSTNTFETKLHDICKPFGDSSNFTSGAQLSTFGKVAPDSGKKLTFGDQPHGTSKFAYTMNKSTAELPESDSNIKPCSTTTSTPKIIFDAGNSSTTPEKNPFAKSVFKDGSSSSTPWTNSLSTTATEKPDFTFGAQPAISVGLTRGSSLKNGSSTNTFETKRNDDICKPFGDGSNFTSGAKSSTFRKVAADSGKTLTFGDPPNGTSQFAYAMTKSTAELPESDSNIKPCPTTTSTPKIIFDVGNSSTTPEKGPFAKSAFEGGSLLTTLSSTTPSTKSLSTRAIAVATKKPAFTFGAQPAMSTGLTLDSSLKNGSSTNTFETKPHDHICKPFDDSSNFTSGAQSFIFGKVAADSGKKLTFGDRRHGTGQFAYATTKSTADLPESDTNIEPCPATTSTPKIIFDGVNSSTTREKSPFANSGFEDGSLTPLSLTTPSTNSSSTTATKMPAFTFSAQPTMSVGLTIGSSLKYGSSTNTFKTKHHHAICKPFGDSSNFTSGAQSSTFGKVTADSGKELTFSNQPDGTSQFAYAATKSTPEVPESNPNIGPCPTTASSILVLGGDNSSITQARTVFSIPQSAQTATAKFNTTTSTMLPADPFDAPSTMLTNLTIGATTNNVERARPVKLIKEEQTKKDVKPASECPVCLHEDVITHIFIPCGHNMFCGDCALKMFAQDDPRCPICRGVIERYIRSYNTA